MNDYRTYKLPHITHARCPSGARSESTARLASVSESQAIRVLSRTAYTRAWRYGDDSVRALSTLGMVSSEHRMSDREFKVLHSRLTRPTFMDRIQCVLHAWIIFIGKTLPELLRVLASTRLRCEIVSHNSRLMAGSRSYLSCL